jgi:hypothetical protein
MYKVIQLQYRGHCTFLLVKVFLIGVKRLHESIMDLHDERLASVITLSGFVFLATNTQRYVMTGTRMWSCTGGKRTAG